MTTPPKKPAKVKAVRAWALLIGNKISPSMLTPKKALAVRGLKFVAKSTGVIPVIIRPAPKVKRK